MAKKLDTIIKNLRKKYPNDMIHKSGRNEFGIVKVTKKGTPPIYYQSKKRYYQAIKDIDGHYKIFDKETGKKIKL